MPRKILIQDTAGNTLDLFINKDNDVVLLVYDGADKMNGRLIVLMQQDVDEMIVMLTAIRKYAAPF